MKKLRILSVVAAISFLVPLLPISKSDSKVSAEEIPVTVQVIDGYTIPDDHFYPAGDKVYFVGTEKGGTTENLFVLENGAVKKVSTQGVDLGLNYNKSGPLKYNFNEDRTELRSVFNEDIHCDLNTMQGVNSADVRVIQLSNGTVKDVHYDYNASIPVDLAKVVLKNIPGLIVQNTDPGADDPQNTDPKKEGEGGGGAFVGFNRIQGTDKFYSFKCEIYTNASQQFHYGIVSTDGAFKENVQPQLAIKSGQIICEDYDDTNKTGSISILDSNLNVSYTMASKEYQEIKIDRDNYLYLGDTTRGEKVNGITKYPFIKINISNPKDQTELPEKISDYPMVSKDGYIWLLGFNNNRLILSKLENGHPIVKYSFDKKPTAMMISDDQNIVFPYINEKTAGIVIVKPNSNPNASTGKEEVIASADKTSNDKVVSATVADITLDKEKTNVVVVSGDASKTVEVKMNVAAIEGGSGAVKVEGTTTVINLPISTIDFTNIPSDSKVVLSQVQEVDTAVLNKVQKAVNKVFDFNLQIQDNNGGVVKSIHNFKEGKARITLKLSDEDIKGLNISKLCMYYFNETTGKFEQIGGTYDSTTKMFTFETSHFSKYILAEASTNGQPQSTDSNVQNTAGLPQTGSPLDTMGLVLIGVLSLIGGIFFIRRY